MLIQADTGLSSHSNVFKCKTDAAVLFWLADFNLSDGLTDLHHAGSLQDDPNSADKMGASR